MSSTSSKQIKITHVDLFYYTHVKDPLHTHNKIECELVNYIAANQEEMCAINFVGERENRTFVGVFWKEKMRWIRAEIDVAGTSESDNEIIVWVTDYGFPMQTEIDSVVVLNDDLKKLCEDTVANVFKGGIYGIMAAEMAQKDKTRMLPTSKWENKAIQFMDQMKASNSSLQLHFSHEFQIENHVFGTLHIHKNGIERSATQALVETYRVAKEVSRQRFERDIVESGTIRINRWLDSNDVLKCIENKRNEKISINQPRETSKDTPSISTLTEQSQDRQNNGIDQQKIMNNYLERMQILGSENKTQAKTNVTTSTEYQELQNNKTTSFMRKIKLTRMLVYNNEENPKQLNECFFSPGVVKSMKQLDLNETFASQAYAWPNIMRGNSLVLVDSQKCAHLLCSAIEFSTISCLNDKCGGENRASKRGECETMCKACQSNAKLQHRAGAAQFDKIS